MDAKFEVIYARGWNVYVADVWVNDDSIYAQIPLKIYRES